MILETLLDSVLSNFDTGGSLSSYVSGFFEIISYIGYLDDIVPVSTLISCSLFLLGWTLICCVVKAVLMVI